jgi:hypothetical protein
LETWTSRYSDPSAQIVDPYRRHPPRFRPSAYVSLSRKEVSCDLSFSRVRFAVTVALDYQSEHSGSVASANRSKEPWYRVETSISGLFPLPTCRTRPAFPWALAQRRHSVSTPSVTPVATGTTGVLPTDPVFRFQQEVAVELAVADLERRVRRLTRELTPPMRPTHAHSAPPARWPRA